MGRFVQSQQDAWRNYDRLAMDPRVLFLAEPPAVETAFRAHTQADSPSHGLWTDAYLAAFAMASQAQLVTLDQGLGRFSGLSLLVLS
jgi:predicted nucleic acid-binding protein